MTSKARARISLISGALLVLALVAWGIAQWVDEPALSAVSGWAFATGDIPIVSWRSLQMVSLLGAALTAGWPIAKTAFQALRYKTFSIDLLVTIAVTGALVIGELVEAGVVAFLFVFGSWIEARSMERTRRSVSDLIDMAPQEADVIRDGETVTVPASGVKVGEHVVVRTGSRVPVDGTVVDGRGHIDESTITGEPVPALKDDSDSVFSGTIVTDGFLTIRAEHVGSDTAFSRIIELVEDAQDSKSSTQRFLDRFSRWYTPTIIVLAVVAFLVTFDAHFALTFLVIACPGALVISTPVSMVAGIGNGARHGVLLKRGDAVERLTAVDTLVVDKTGTLTHGRPTVVEVVGISSDAHEVLRLAAAVETASEHPLGTAVVKATAEVSLSPVSDVRVHAGSGISGTVEGTEVAVGSRRLVNEYCVTLGSWEKKAQELETAGATVFFVIVAGKLAGMIAVADTIRPEAKALSQLHEWGIRDIVMLTGDNPRTATAVARELGIDQVEAELLPEHKVDAVQELTAQGRKVAMIGDGINDAPAIAAAHVGIAMGTGTDVSIDTADVVLAGGRFDQLVHARQLVQATVRNVRQNTFIALATVVALLVGVVAGAVFMSVGILVHEASVLVVVLNAVRLVRFKAKIRKLDADQGEKSTVELN